MRRGQGGLSFLTFKVGGGGGQSPLFLSKNATFVL